MKMLSFANRNFKEIIRDPLTVAFSLGFPVVLLLLLSAIQANIPVSLFEIEHLAPGMTIFGLSFMTLFSATLIARDRESAMLARLYTSPLSAADFILGYMLPLIPIAVMQCVVCFIVAAILGMKITLNVLLAVALIIPPAVLFIGLGLLCGSLLNVKQVGGICGAMLTNVAAFMSGIWFDLNLVGGAFKRAAYCLPFVHAVELERAAVSGNYAEMLPHIAVVLAYAAVITVIAIIAFLKKMKQ